MDELLAKCFASPAWWVSVVVVGFLVSLFAAFARSPLDNLLRLLSKTYVEHSNKKRQGRLFRATLIAKSPFAYQSYLTHFYGLITLSHLNAFASVGISFAVPGRWILLLSLPLALAAFVMFYIAFDYLAVLSYSSQLNLKDEDKHASPANGA